MGFVALLHYLFFILSGFVIASAYGQKLENGSLNIRDFVLIRIIRLYPVYFISFLLCTAVFVGKFYLKALPGATIEGVVFIIALTALILPSGAAAGGNLFQVNTPYWSLFFELIINFIYAFVRPYLNTRILIATIALFGEVVCWSSISHGGLDVGFAWGFKSMITGFSRAGFGIFFGVLLQSFASKRPRQYNSQWASWAAIAVILAVLMSPSAGNLNFIIDIFVVLVCFPVCVMIASNGRPTIFSGTLLALGAASYPIYVLHVPIGQIVSFITRGSEVTTAPYSGIAFILILVQMAVWIEKYFDIPMRRALTSKFISR